MIDSIKITSLTNIGANLSYTSIVPVVDVTANVTYKANLQIIGNLILSGAGGSNFVQAAQANLAQAVVNSAQPNITSVGTLISLAVTGNANVSGLTSLTTLNVATAANLGAVGNIVITGGTVGQKLTTNGNGGLSWTNDADSSYSNSNVAAYLPTYTGNIGAGNINVTGLTSLAVLTVSTTANLGAANNITITGGSNGQVLTTNGNGVLSWTTVSGNGIGSALVNGNNSFVLDVDGNVVFEGTPSGNAVNRGLVWDYGANANGVNSMIRQDNAGLTVRAWTEDAGNYAASVNIVTNQDANAKTWEFDGQGNLTLPGNLIVPEGNIESGTIAPAVSSAITGITTGNPTVFVTLAGYVFGDPVQGEVTISGVTGTTEANGVWGYQATDPNEFQLYTDATLTTPVDGTTWTTYISGGTAIGAGAYTDFTIQGGNVSVSSNDNSWEFGADGNLLLAGGNSVIQSIANSSLDPILPNVSTMVLTPDANYNAQALVLDPTSPGHIHLRSPGANIDEPYSNIFLGGETSSFEVGYHNGAAPNLFIHSGNNTWTFDNAGYLTTPGNLVIAGNTSVFGTDAALIQSTDDLPLVAISSGANGAIATSWVEDIGNIGTSNIASVYANPMPGSKIIRIAVGQNGGPGPNLWDFDTTGNLTIPGTSGGFIKTVSNASIGVAAMDNGTNNPAQLLSINVGNGNATSIISAYATNVAIQTNASGNINTWSFGNTGAVQSPIVTFSALPAATTPGLRAFISDANLVPAGNFGVEVSGGGGNYVPVFSDGANWCIG